jgi:hypothetical protein
VSAVPPTAGGRRALAAALAVAAVGCLAAGVWLAVPGGTAADTAAPGEPAASEASGPAGASSAPPASVALNPPLTVTPAARIAPVSLDIPAIGVRTRLGRLQLGAGGELVPPADFGLAGWYAEGTAPGQPGPAVLAGHVDSVAGPAVFYRLAELKAGDAVLVRRADGSTLRYVVSAMVRYPKARFPTDLVYAPVPDTELRLITCGGTFDRSVRSYRDNIIVSAVVQPG